MCSTSVQTRFTTLCLFWSWCVLLALVFNYVLLLTNLWTTDPKIGNVPTSPIWTGFAEKSLAWGLVQNQSIMCYRFQNYEQLTLQLEMCATTWTHVLLLTTYEQVTLQVDMCAATCPQAPSEQVLPRNLLPGGLCKINQVCAIASKLMNNWPCNWKCVALPAHKPHLNRFCLEISSLGACAKSTHYVVLLTNFWNNWPCNWTCVALPATSPILNRFCPEIPFQGPCAKSTHYVVLLTNFWTTDPAIGHVWHYLPTSPIWTGFAQKSPPRGACAKSIEYVLLLTNLWTTDPAIGHVCHYLNRFCPGISLLGLVQNQSSMCYCFRTYEQLTLQLEMCATTCPQAPSEQVLPRNLVPGGLCKIKQVCVLKLINTWPCNWKCVPLPAHKPHLNRFCPEISFLGACAKSIKYTLLLTN